MTRPIARAALGAALALGCAVATATRAHAQQSAADQPDTPEITRLTVSGVKHVDVADLRTSIVTTASHCKSLLLAPFCLVSHSSYWYRREYLNHGELAKDVLRIRVYYWLRGYRDATVDTTVSGSPKSARVTFAVHEGEPTRVARIAVDRPVSLIDDRHLKKYVSLHAGDPLNLLQLDTTIVRLDQSLWDKGYADAVVDTTITVDSATRTADVHIGVDPRWKSTVGSISVYGNRDVSQHTILSSMSMKPGDTYRRTELLKSQRRLYESNLFKRAAIVVPPQGDTVKQLEVDVVEAPLRAARFAVGFNTVDFFEVDGRFAHYNFFGGARRLDVDVAVANLLSQPLNGRGIFQQVAPAVQNHAFFLPTWHASVSVEQPWFHSAHNTIAASVFAHRRAYPGIFIDHGEGASATFTREVADRTPVSLDYHFEVTRVEAGDIYFCVNYGVCELSTIGALRANQRLSPLALTANVSRANDPLEPRTGYQGNLTIEHASAFTMSDFRYNRALADYALYHPVGAHAVLAFHARAGWVKPLSSTGAATGFGTAPFANDILHPRVRFYSGGARSVRGYGENLLGPLILTVPANKLAAAGCDTSYAMIRDCTGVNSPALLDRDFTPRPTGGNTLFEGSVEYRFPTFLGLGAAVFLDGAVVGAGSVPDARTGMAAITPGIGLRYFSRVGPIRVDLGINPGLSERLVVVSEAINPTTGEREVVRLRDQRVYDPTAAGSGINRVMHHIVLHLSIGEAY